MPQKYVFSEVSFKKSFFCALLCLFNTFGYFTEKCHAKKQCSCRIYILIYMLYLANDKRVIQTIKYLVYDKRKLLRVKYLFWSAMFVTIGWVIKFWEFEIIILTVLCITYVKKQMYRYIEIKILHIPIYYNKARAHNHKQ